jgi:homoserine O-succinyltransferase
MPIKIPNGLPAIKTLIEERISIIQENDAIRQDVRPLRIVLLNLMPDKITTETQLARVLGSTPLQIELTLLRTDSYLGQNTSEEHQLGFYKVWDDIKDENFDGIIITGAPVETMEFKDVEYWPELTQIMDWAETNVFAKFFICWGAQAGMYHHYGVPKHEVSEKIFGVYHHERLDRSHPLIRGFDDVFAVPVSRYTGVDEQAVSDHPDLLPLAKAEGSGVCLVVNDAKRHSFMFNHLEYDRETLQGEYERDLAKGLNTALPRNYYADDNADNAPSMTWRSHRNLLFMNWINQVYQDTPYDLSDL